MCSGRYRVWSRGTLPLQAAGISYPQPWMNLRDLGAAVNGEWASTLSWDPAPASCPLKASRFRVSGRTGQVAITADTAIPGAAAKAEAAAADLAGRLFAARAEFLPVEGSVVPHAEAVARAFDWHAGGQPRRTQGSDQLVCRGDAWCRASQPYVYVCPLHQSVRCLCRW